MQEVLDVQLNSEFYEKLCQEIHVYLKEKSKRSTKPWKLYFSGEFDSNQSIFEGQSNFLKLGVLANDEECALIMLRLLRIITDDNIQIFDWQLQDYENKQTPLKTLIDQLKEPTAYIDSYRLTANKLKRKMCDNTIIEHYVCDVDIWTMKRIFEDGSSSIYDLLEL